VQLCSGGLRNRTCQGECSVSFAAAVIADADPSQLAPRSRVQPSRRYGQRALDFTKQLSCTFTDPNATLAGVPARTDNEQVAMLAPHDPLEPTWNGEVGLDREIRVAGKRCASLLQHVRRVAGKAFSVHRIRQHHERIRIDSYEHQFGIHGQRDRFAEDDGVIAFGVTIDTDSDPCNRGG
jgi:hypothetical protein